MSDLDLNRLRRFLDEEEHYARAISAADPRSAVAKEMLALITDARARLRPSADGTANYVPVKSIIEDLGTLRAQAEALAASRSDRNGG
ncbi:MAG TPA: hypothetical protein VFK15_15365 [Burkholderiales bacterium]|nr:hypothetical protein [Burkholderiales bacterium]